MRPFAPNSSRVRAQRRKKNGRRPFYKIQKNGRPFDQWRLFNAPPPARPRLDWGFVGDKIFSIRRRPPFFFGVKGARIGGRAPLMCLRRLWASGPPGARRARRRHSNRWKRPPRWAFAGGEWGAKGPHIGGAPRSKKSSSTAARAAGGAAGMAWIGLLYVWGRVAESSGCLLRGARRPLDRPASQPCRREGATQWPLIGWGWRRRRRLGSLYLSPVPITSSTPSCQLVSMGWEDGAACAQQGSGQANDGRLAPRHRHRLRLGGRGQAAKGRVRPRRRELDGQAVI